MTLRSKKTLLLSVVFVLFVVMILDFGIRKVEPLERFSEQFADVERTQAHQQANHGVTKTYERELEIAGTGAGLRELQLSGTNGPITVQRATGDNVSLHYAVTVSASDAEAAARKNSAVNIEQHNEEGKVTLAAMAGGKTIDHDDYDIAYTLLVPAGIKLRLHAEEESIRLEGLRGDAEVTSRGGLVELAGITGNVIVNGSYGNVYASGINGTITLNNQSGTATIEDVQGDVVLDSRSGKQFIRRVQGAVRGVTEGGPVYVSDIIGSVNLSGHDGDIGMDGIRGDIKVVTRSGTTDVVLPKDGGFSYNVEVNEGNLLTKLPFISDNPDNENMTSLKGTTGTGKWKVDITASFGDVIIHSPIEEARP
ncbi:Putative adhesin [Paenibacillus sp. BC26]|nr:Putative adhesin [Paenibacillus sp. BC26]